MDLNLLEILCLLQNFTPSTATTVLPLPSPYPPGPRKTISNKTVYGLPLLPEPVPLLWSPPPPYHFIQPTEDIFNDDDLSSFVFAKDKTDTEPKIQLNLPKDDTDENVCVVPSDDEMQVTKNINDADIQILSKPTLTIYIRPKRKRRKRKKGQRQPYDKIPDEDEPRRKPNLNDPETRWRINELKNKYYTRKANKKKFEKDGLLFIKQSPLHLKERLKRRFQQCIKKDKKPKEPDKQLQKKVAELEDELKMIKVVPSHPRDRLARKVKAL